MPFSVILDKLYPVFYGDIQERQRFSFNIYDFDRDGLLSSGDLTTFSLSLPKGGPLYEELRMFVDDYIVSTILTKKKKKQA